jgi:hypothetical protein
VVDLLVYAPDDRLNLIEGGSMFGASHTALTGQVAIVGGSVVLDDFGFYNQRVLINSTGTACDLSVDPSCSWKRLFQSWGAGLVGSVAVTGAPTTDTNPCAPDALTVTTTTRGVLVLFITTGAIQ